MEHLVSHIRHELVKILHRFIYVYHSSPFALLEAGTSCRAVRRTEGCELGTLAGMGICQHTGGRMLCLLTDVGNSSSISEVPMRGGPSSSRREYDGWEKLVSQVRLGRTAPLPHLPAPVPRVSGPYPARPIQLRPRTLQATASPY